MSDSSAIKVELDAIASAQKRAIGWLLSIAGALFIAFVLAAGGLMLKVERIDTVISERFGNVLTSLDRLESSIAEVARAADGKYEGIESRVRTLESRVDRIEGGK